MDPQGPSQPSLETVYKTPGNAASANPAEKNAREHSHPHGQHVDERLPTGGRSSGVQQRQDAAQPSSLGYGVRGAPAGEESQGLTEEDVGRHKELEGEQMVAGPGEGRVASAVENKHGATGSEPDLLANLDR
ncbi:uncharacterized protein PG998_004673 [Apiospora kogelbergensis]|uniref:Uncharacterized protein n=1 Tax=Apiospora kogelbergensis TaxID=1337665 RepID=A0AAW0QAT6_9PEZI